MHGDFSRQTFQAADHFAAVLFQQGRVQLDADFNEHARIMLHYLRTVVADIVGPAAAPKRDAGFEIRVVKGDDGKIAELAIGPGRMYVDGLLVENDGGDRDDDTTWTGYWNQPDGFLDPDAPGDQLPQGKPFVAYLRVWEQLVNSVQAPRIREVALGDPGPDTAARARVVWQLATLPVTRDPGTRVVTVLANRLAEAHPRPGRMVARARRPHDVDADPCHLPPEARFRGPENQLYRIEVHSGGPAAVLPEQGRRKALSGATFKWSRENGSVVFPVVSVSGNQVRLASLGRDGKLGLEIGDWVELTDDAVAARVADDRDLTTVQRAPALLRVTAIDADSRTVTLSGRTPGECGMHRSRHPMLRRWDHSAPTRYDSDKQNIAADGALPIVENVWIAVEDGLEVLFTPPRSQPMPSDGDNDRVTGTYRPGDHWIFAARTVTGDIEWPQGEDGPIPRLPDGVRYHYAALAFIDGQGKATDRRHQFDHLPDA
ncbi:DUF6519 domain-containing protein [Nocardia sp. CDC159]|uniref:DUF6519 domain-containing protein n=1 Tax=Nocardia pulmonis TaxID=2951408 RepID=A0A9X2E9J6_9NOCA|nr:MULTISPECIES: DUF6519 domain-containing protein [Nocardia]MCM6776627.1 DUF6519 domain-containing protein [Nocardia pulmonis]MCM6789224.1 DUF6519 domain-containing protein [Nocardia sp. CDC159]